MRDEAAEGSDASKLVTRMKKAIVSFVTGLLLAGIVWGQTHKVAPKPENVVRAVGVYEWTGDLAKPTASRFVPVTVFIDGELQDAGIYKPQPVPFALLSGNIYELDDAGISKGTLVLESALRAVTPDGAPGPAFDEGWTAYGTYQPPASEQKATHLKPSKTLPVIQVSGGDSGRPHLTNKSGDTTPNQQQQPAKPDAAPNPQGGSSAPSEDPDRPTMHRRTASDDSSTGGTKNSSEDEAERPTLKRRSPEEEKARKKKNDIATVTEEGSLNDDPDRPRLHHGSGKSEDTEPPKLMGLPRDMHQMIGVSDAKNRDPHPFARPWEDANERAAVLAKMQAFARAKLAEYGVVPGVTPPNAVAGTVAGASAANAPATVAPPDTGPPTLKRGIPPKASVTTETAAGATKTTAQPARSTTTTAKRSSHTRSGAKSRKAATAPPPVTLADEVLKGYTLSYGGAPTYVYMAHTVETGAVMRYVTIVAQADAMGNLKVALASATDAAHLDRTPWMRLIDAVDAEASNRASLLFELRGQSSRQFALYRVIAAKPEQIFVTGSGM